MVFNQIEHLIKMANDLQSNATWSIILCIYLLPTHSPIFLPTYLLIYIYFFTYLFMYLPIFLPLYDLLVYLPTYLHITYLPIHPLTYLNLTIKCNSIRSNHNVQLLCLTIRFKSLCLVTRFNHYVYPKFNQILAIRFQFNQYVQPLDLALGLA